MTTLEVTPKQNQHSTVMGHIVTRKTIIMNNTEKYFLTFVILLLITSCDREDSFTPENYKLDRISSKGTEVYTNSVLVENHNYNLNQIINNEFYTNDIISEINFDSKDKASFKYQGIECQISRGFLSKNISVTYKNDSIYFYSKAFIENQAYYLDIHGIKNSDSIALQGFIYALDKTIMNGLLYEPLSKDWVLDLIWPDDTKNITSDTLVFYHFEQVFKKYAP